jgi:hypothetical protein
LAWRRGRNRVSSFNVLLKLLRLFGVVAGSSVAYMKGKDDETQHRPCTMLWTWPHVIIA